MNLQGPLVKQITAEILHHVKSLCIIYMDNLLVTILFIATLKISKDSFCFTSLRTNSHTLGLRKAIHSLSIYRLVSGRESVWKNFITLLLHYTF